VSFLMEEFPRFVFDSSDKSTINQGDSKLRQRKLKTFIINIG